VRIWGDPEAEAARRAAENERTMDELQRAGVDLDPTARRAPGEDRSSDDEPGADHGHSHRRPEPGTMPPTGIIGAGAVGTALGVALSRAGWPVHAVASRDRTRRERFRALVPGARGFAEPNALLDDVDLVIIAVPDDAVATLSERLRLYSGQAVVHTSGLLGADVLRPAMAAGTHVGSFHPLVPIADTERAVADFHGATVAVEGDDDLVSLLADMADAIGARAVRLAPGSKPAYHAAAVLAAGGLIALLDAIVRLGSVAGMDEPTALSVYLPLMRRTLANAEALGVADALTGPLTRGDAGTLNAHQAVLEQHAPDVAALYRVLGERELELARKRGLLTPEAATRLAASLAKKP
jgi:predicted short-subunit dehydrogenase-like oxidoreductase (DUF2520 family)